DRLRIIHLYRSSLCSRRAQPVGETVAAARALDAGQSEFVGGQFHQGVTVGAVHSIRGHGSISWPGQKLLVSLQIVCTGSVRNEKAPRWAGRDQHSCWDGCLFPNAVMMRQAIWNDTLAFTINPGDEHGWNRSD